MAGQILEVEIPWGYKTRIPGRRDPCNALKKKLDAAFADSDMNCNRSAHSPNETRFDFVGRDADEMFSTVESILSASEWVRKGKVVKRYGVGPKSAYASLKWKGEQWRVVRSQGTKPKPSKPRVKKVKKPTLKEARRLIAANRSDSREKGFHMLLEFGRRDEAAKFASQEPYGRIVDHAMELLYPAPAELVIHYATMVRGAYSSSNFRFGIAQGNYLYAQDALANVYSSRRKLHPTLIEAAGLAYFQSFAPFLEKYLDVYPTTLECAIVEEGKKEGRRDELGSLPMDEIWSWDTQCAINSVVALRRMDQPLEKSAVKELTDGLAAMGDCMIKRKTIAMLDWVLFDLGAIRSHRKLFDYIETHIVAGCSDALPDLLTTLLKRGERKEINRIARRILKNGSGVSLTDREFIYWPLSNYLDNHGFLTYTKHEYKAAMARKIAPPPWWKWESSK